MFEGTDVAVKPKKSAGRPALSEDGVERLTIRFPEHILSAVDAIVAERGHVTDRATVIRELIVDGLKAQKRWGK